MCCNQAALTIKSGKQWCQREARLRPRLPLGRGGRESQGEESGLQWAGQRGKLLAPRQPAQRDIGSALSPSESQALAPKRLCPLHALLGWALDRTKQG